MLKDPYEGPALFHVGYPKTASTYLQYGVFSNSSFGFGMAGGQENRSHIMHWFRTDDPYLFEPDKVSEDMIRLEKPVRDRGLVPVWSEETFVGNPLTRCYDGAWMLEKLHSTGRAFQIVFTIRNQADLILSAYREYLKLNRNSLRDFVGTGHEPRSFRPIFHPEYLLYDIAVNSWAEAFGRENILVLPQELLRSDPEDYIKRLLSCVGISTASEVPSQAYNVGRGGTALLAARTLNAFFTRSPLSAEPSFSEKTVQKLLSTVNKLSPRSLDMHIESRWRSEIEDRIRGYYDASNTQLGLQIGLDLARFGYPVQ